MARLYPTPSRRPTLFAVVVGVKDIFRVDGFATRAGSRLPAEALAGEEAEAVRRLRHAGALVLGKTVTTEFAYLPAGGPRRPFSPRRRRREAGVNVPLPPYARDEAWMHAFDSIVLPLAKARGRCVS